MRQTSVEQPGYIPIALAPHFMPPSLMRKFLIITAVVLLAIPLVLLGTAWVFRDSLIRSGVDSLFAQSDIQLTRLEGLQLHKDHVTLDALNVKLPAGQLLEIAALEVHFSFVSWHSMPVIETLIIDSARVAESANLIAEAYEQDTIAASNDTLQLSRVFTLLREFPVAAIDIRNLALFQRQAPLVVTLQHLAGVLHAQLDSGPLQLLVQFTQADAASTALLQADLTNNAEVAGHLQLTLEPGQNTYLLTGNGELSIPDINALLGELQGTPLDLPLTGANLDWDLAGTIADDVLGTLTESGAPGVPASFEVGVQQGAEISLPAQLTSGLGELTLVLSDDARMTVSTGTGFGINTAHLPFRLSTVWQNQPVGIDTLLTLTDCSLISGTPCHIGFNGNASYGTYTLTGNLVVDAPGLAAEPGDYRVKTTGLVLGGLPGWHPAFDLDASITLAPDFVRFSSPLVLNGAQADAGLVATGNYVFATGAAGLQLALPPLTFTETGTSLSSLVPGWPYPVDLLSGEMTANLDMQWLPDTSQQQSGRMTATLTGTLHDVGGYYTDYFFRGANSELTASAEYTSTDDTLVFATPPLTLTIAGIDIGLPMENLAFQLQLDRNSQQVQIASLSAETLGGMVTGTDVNYDFTRARNELVVHFSGLDLERMLVLVEYDGVQAAGTVSGEIPITFTETGIEVAAGSLQADAPGGSIRYLNGAEAGLQGNAGLDLVNQALGNYQFTSMTSSIDYSPAGELLLTMQLKGHNPDMDKDQPINLNLTLTDNIPALMKSLQAARAIEDFLELQYR